MRRTTLPVILAIALSTMANAQISIPAERLETHVSILAADSLLGRGFGTPQGRQAAEYIAQQFREAGIEPLNGTFLHPFNHRRGILNIPGINVAGVIPGSDPELKEEFIVLGAHYDHLGWYTRDGDTVVFNGADDNASGTASIIEIGRKLASNRETLGRSVIVVAFDGEESGLVGSKYFVRNTIPAEQIKLMFSLDMVGMYEAHKGVDLEGIKTLNSPERLTKELAEKYNLTIRKANSSIPQNTDTAPFGQAGIPAIAAFTGYESPYHKPDDTASLLDYDGMALIAAYLCDASMELSRVEKISDMKPAGEAEPLASVSKRIRPGVRVNLGSGEHNYREEFYHGKSIFAAEAGFFASIKAAGFLYIQPEVLYETKGSRHEDGTFRTHSITAPLNLQISSPENEYLRTYFQIGGYYSYHFGGKLGDSKIDYQDTYNPNEYGISFGFGVEVMNMQWGIYLQRGLSGILQAQGAGRIMHENVYFMLGYIF
jgi:hypothetical protein